MNRRLIRHRRWIAFVALIGLLFQQLAMAAYLCPQEVAAMAAPTQSAMPPCHGTAPPTDPARCHEHCAPTTASANQAPALTVPPAVLPATTWLHLPQLAAERHESNLAYRLRARAQPPPLTVQYCTFQI